MKHWLQIIVIILGGLVLISACGFAQPGQQLAALPTVTPESAATLTTAPPTGPTSTPTITNRYADDIEAAQAAADQGDYERAITILAPIYGMHRDDETVAAMLAGFYRNWGRQVISADPAEPGIIRDALDLYIRASVVAPLTGEGRNQFDQEQGVVELLLETWATIEQLRRLTSAGGSAEEQAAAIESALTASAKANESLPTLPGVREARTAALVEAAGFQMRVAKDASNREARTTALRQARELCTSAVDLWPADAPQSELARACLRDVRVAIQLNEPTPTPSDNTARSGGSAASNPGSGRVFISIPQRTFPPGPFTEERNSCISGTVVSADGKPIAGAVGNVNNAAAFLNWTTDASGRYSVCGLGWSNWAVVLDYVPGEPGLSRQVAIGGVWLDGTSQQQAIIVFRERR